MHLRACLFHGVQAGSRREGAFQRGIPGALQQLRHQGARQLLRGGILLMQGPLLSPEGIAAGRGAEVLLHKIQAIGGHRLLPDAHRADGAAHGNQQHRRKQNGKPAFFHTAPPPSAAGHRTVNTAPPSGRLAAETVPPRLATVSCTMERPRPVPPAARERALSTR